MAAATPSPWLRTPFAKALAGAMRRPGAAGSRPPIWTPASLAFTSGLWVEQDDLSTLYQDSAGTSPVTTVGQPEGLWLDKRLGLVRGPELVSNGTFIDGTTTGWTPQPGIASLSVVNGAMRLTNISAGFVHASTSVGFPTVVGKAYEVTCDFIKGTNSGGYLLAGNSLYPSNWGIGPLTTSGPKRFIFVATVTTTYLDVANADGNGTYNDFDNLSCRLLDGNHLLQATTSARPLYSKRVNLLTKTEAFSDAAWLKVGSPAVTDGAALAPDGTMTASLLVPTSSNASLYQTINAPAENTMYFAAKAAGKSLLWFIDGSGGGSAVTFDLSAGTYSNLVAGYIATVTPMAQGFYLCGLKKLTGNYTYFQLGVTDTGGSVVTSADGTKGVLLWRPQFERGSVSTRYQRINTATDYDTVGFPAFGQFDGVDDGMSTGAIVLGADMDCFIAVRRASSANCVLFNGGGASAYGGYCVSGGVASTFDGAGTPTLAIDGIDIASPTGGNVHTALTVGNWHIFEAHNIDPSTWAAFKLSSYGGSFQLNGNIAGVILCPAQTPENRTKIRQYLGAKVGLTLS